MATQVVVPNRSLPGLVPSPLEPFPQLPESLIAPSTIGLRIPAPAEERGQIPGSQAELERIVIVLLPLVKRMALQMRERLPLHVDVDDLVSTGVLGLVDAIQKFDRTKQVKLEQYARHRIRGAILDGLRVLDPASRDMRKKNKKAERVYRRLETKFGRPPSDMEMAEGLGIGLSSWYRTVRDLQAVGIEWLRPMGSVGMKENRTLSEESLAAVNGADQFEACFRREQKDLLDDALERIPERERQVIRLYYQQELTMREIGDRLGIDESRVSQLHSAALIRLRKRIKDLARSPIPAVPGWAW